MEDKRKRKYFSIVAVRVVKFSVIRGNVGPFLIELSIFCCI